MDDKQGTAAISRRGVMRAAGGAALADAAVGVVGPLGPVGLLGLLGLLGAEPASVAIAGGGLAQLVIEDGSPHWLSPDIWVVPGTEPNGSVGVPVAGETAYVYARVSNVGGADATDAKISFHWGDPVPAQSPPPRSGRSCATQHPGHRCGDDAEVRARYTISGVVIAAASGPSGCAVRSAITGAHLVSLSS